MVVGFAIGDVAGARPVGQCGRVAVEFVANQGVQLADGLQSASDGFVHLDFGCDVDANGGGFLGGRLLEIGDQLVQPLDEVGGHFVFQKGFFDRCGVGGEGAGGIEQVLVVGSARQAELVFQSRRVESHGARRAVDGQHRFAQVFAECGFGGGDALRGTATGRLVDVLAVQFDDDLRDSSEKLFAETAFGKSGRVCDAEIAHSFQHLVTFDGDAVHSWLDSLLKGLTFGVADCCV